MSPDERLRYHQQRSGPVLSRLYEYIEEQLQEGGVEPNSAVAKALKYLENNRECLGTYRQVRQPCARDAQESECEMMCGFVARDQSVL